MKGDNMEEKKKQQKRLFLLLLLLLLAAGVYGIYSFFFAPKPVPMTVISGDFLPDGKDASKMSDKDLAAYAQKSADASTFNMMIVSEATISSQTQTGALSIKNPESNVYPINVEIREDQTSQLIYTSGAIYPGEEIIQITLETELAVGTYQTTADFSLYDPQTKKKQGEVSAGVTIVVE